VVEGQGPPLQDAEAKAPLVNWPEGVPRWEPYLCWQIGKTELDCIEELKRFAAEEFEERFGARPDHAFCRLGAIYVGPVKS